MSFAVLPHWLVLPVRCFVHLQRLDTPRTRWPGTATPPIVQSADDLKQGFGAPGGDFWIGRTAGDCASESYRLDAWELSG